MTAPTPEQPGAPSGAVTFSRLVWFATILALLWAASTSDGFALPVLALALAAIHTASFLHHLRKTP